MLTKISRKKQTLWRFIFANIDFIIGIGNGLILIPIYFIFIDVDLYGAWLATGSIIAWLSITDPGIGIVVQQKVSEFYAKNDRANIEKVLSSTLILLLVSVFFILLIGYFFEINLADIINNDKNNIDIIVLQKAFRYSIYGLAFTVAGYSVGDSLMGLQRSKESSIIRTSSLLFGFLLKFLFLYSGYGLISIPLANLSGSFFYFFMTFIYLIYILIKEKISLKFEFLFFKSFLTFFYFTFFSKMTTTFKKNVDLLIIARFIGVEIVTVYEMTRRPMSMVFGLIRAPAVAMLAPLANLKGENLKKEYSNIIFQVLFVIIIIILTVYFMFLIFNESLINLWVGENLYLGNFQSFGLVTVFLISTLCSIISLFTFSLGNIIGNSKIEIIRDILGIALICVLGYFNGIWGIIIGYLISSLFTEIIYFPKKLLQLIHLNNNKIRLLIRTFLIYSFVGLFLLLISSMLNIDSWYELVLYSIIFLIIMVSTPILISQRIKNNFVVIINLIL